MQRQCVKTLTDITPDYCRTQFHKQGQHKIKFTKHSLERCDTRVDGQERIRVLACRARYNGISVHRLLLGDVYNNQELYNYLRDHYWPKPQQDIRVYDKYIFVFAGHHNRTLITVMNIPDRFLVAQ